MDCEIAGAEALVVEIMRCLERGDDAAFRSLADEKGIGEIDEQKFSCATPKGSVVEHKLLHFEVRYVPWDDIYDGMCMVINVPYQPGEKSNADFIPVVFKLGRSAAGKWFVRGLEYSGGEVSNDFIREWKARNGVERKGWI